MPDAPEILSGEPLLVEPVLPAPVLVEPVAVEPVAVAPVAVAPLAVEPVLVEPVAVAPVVEDPVWAGTVVTDQVVAPVVAAPPIVEPVVVESVAAVAPITATTVRRSYARSIAPDAVIAALVGLFILLVGLLAITRGGFDGPLDSPVVSVLGFTHTTALGLIEVLIGGCLLLSGATRSRSAALFFGSVLGIASFVGAVQTESFQNNLALESGFAWLMVFGGVIVVLSALLIPRYMQRSTVVYTA